MKDKILFVDDDANVLEAYQRKLQSVLHVDTAEGGIEGLMRLAKDGPYAVVVADMNMPGMNGIELLARVKEEAPETVRMMLTGNMDMNTAIEAVNEGSIFQFLTKPCPAEAMGKALAAGINQHRLITAEKAILEDTLNGALELLVEILSWADPDAFGQALHLRGTARSIARVLKLTNLWEVELAALLSRIGSIVLPRDLVARARGGETLSEDETRVLQHTPQTGYELLSRIPRLEPVARIVLYQDKRFDGSGFPDDHISGAAIPVGSRILKVLTDFGELESKGMKRRDALAQMRDSTGWYDPRVIDAAIGLYVLPDNTPRIDTTTTTDRRISALQTGDILVSGVKTLDGRLLVAEGEVVTEVLLLRLRTYMKLVGLQEPTKVRRPQSPG